MSKFLVEPSASMALGNTCAGCMTHKHEDGFVNTNLDVLGRGRIYFCAGCIREMAREVGCVDGEQWQKLLNQLSELSVANEQLQLMYEQEKQNKVVSLSEVLAMVEKKKPAKASA